MEYKKLGKTELEVSEVGLGCWAIGGTDWGPTEDKDSIAAIQRALDLGVNFLDTADVYGFGHSEELIAKVIRGRRIEVIVASKVGNDFYQGEPVRSNYKKSYLIWATEQCLKRLKTDYLDLIQLHGASMELIKQGEVFEALDTLKEQGKIRFGGLSVTSFKEEEGLEALKIGKVDTLQIRYNLLEQEANKELIPQAYKQEVGVIIRIPLLFGLLAGKFTEATRFPDGDHRRERLAPDILKRELGKMRQLKFLVKEEKQPWAVLALRFILSNPMVSTVIPGAKNPGQVEQNCQASDAGPLSAEQLERISEIYGSFK